MTLVTYFSDLSSSLLSLLVVTHLYVGRCHFHFYTFRLYIIIIKILLEVTGLPSLIIFITPSSFHEEDWYTWLLLSTQQNSC